jgi:hypothetical protein
MRRAAGLAAGRRRQAVRASRLATGCRRHQPERRRSRPSGEQYPPRGVSGRSGQETLSGDLRDTAQPDPALRVIGGSGLPSGLITGVYARSDRDERPPMPVSHAHAKAVTSTDERGWGEVPGLLKVLAQVPDPRQRRGRRYCLAFVLAVAVACVLAGAKTFREIGDQAADLPREVLARLGGKPRPLRRTLIVPSQKSGGRRWAGASRWGPTRQHAGGVAGAPVIPQTGPQSRPPKASRPDTRRPSMRERTPPVPGKDATAPCGGRHAPRRAWPAPPPPQPRHRIGRTTAARRGGEQA